MTRTDLSFEPWLVGDLSTLGLIDQLIEEKINSICSYLKKYYGKNVPCSLIDDMLKLYDIDYFLLPQYLKNKLDYFDVY